MGNEPIVETCHGSSSIICLVRKASYNKFNRTANTKVHFRQILGQG